MGQLEKYRFILSRYSLSNETHDTKALLIFEHNHLLFGAPKMVTYAIQPYKQEGKSSHYVKSLGKSLPDHGPSTIFFFSNNVQMPSPQLSCSPPALENSTLLCFSPRHKRIKAPASLNK